MSSLAVALAGLYYGWMGLGVVVVLALFFPFIAFFAVRKVVMEERRWQASLAAMRAYQNTVCFEKARRDGVK